ncbi:MAG: hypothetical protein AAF757_23165 [Cyanobacteria bacterium P01_D01_bin.116]
MYELVFKPAYELARMIKERQVSSVEVLEAYLNQISQHNSKLNAVCTASKNLPIVAHMLTNGKVMKNSAV